MGFKVAKITFLSLSVSVQVETIVIYVFSSL